METLSRKDIERIKKIELLRKLLQLIFLRRIKLFLIIFGSLLVLIFTGVYFFVTHSATRYIAEVSLYYFPKTARSINSFDSKYVLQMLNRQSVRHRFYEELSENGERVPCAIKVDTHKKDSRRYDISVSANLESNAVTFANTFAEQCVKSYIEERTQNLENWKKVLQQKKQDVFKDISQVNLARHRLGAPVNAPEKDFEQLRVIMEEQQSTHTKLNLTIANLEHRQKKLQSDISKLNPALSEFEKEIREFLETQKTLDRELMLARQLYTENNPKLIALMERKKSSDTAFAAFLKDKKLTAGDLNHLGEGDTVKTELKTVTDELEARRAEMRVLDIEIASTNNRFHRLNEILPHIQQLNQQNASLMESLQTIDASIADINYLLPLIKDDLKIGVKATKAWGSHPFDAKNVAIGLFAALAISGFAATLMMILEFIFGRVSGENELKLFYQFRYLGELPVQESLSEAESEVEFNTICHMFQASVTQHHIVLTGTLPGGRLPTKLFETFEWNYAMAGKRMLSLEMVLANTFEDPGYECDDTGIIVYSGSKGYLPVASKRLLAPTEIELIKRDFTTLRKSYDLIMIHHSASLRRDHLFLEQIALLCDGAIIVVGAGKTRRRNVRALAAMHEKTKMPIMTVLSHSDPDSAPDSVDNPDPTEAES